MVDLDLGDKRVFIRVDFNVPLRDGELTDDSRIVAALPTIELVRKQARMVVLASHLGRPKNGQDTRFSLAPVAERLRQLLDCDVALLQDYGNEPIIDLLQQIPEASVVLLENLRFHKGEKTNDRRFAEKLVAGLDVYINDAFATMHRQHASVVGAVQYFPIEQRAVGLLVEKELSAFDKALAQPQRPFVVILGGGKVHDKLAVILNLMRHCTHLLIGGGMAYTFLRHQGYRVGKSLVDTRAGVVDKIIETATRHRVEIILPCDHLAASEFTETASPVYLDTPQIDGNLRGLDIGKKTIDNYRQIIALAKTIIWNGPLGVFEWPAFANGTRAIAQACHDNNGLTIVGGGDSCAAIKKFALEDGFTHVSTGGGASLSYLEGNGLVGLNALSSIGESW